MDSGGVNLIYIPDVQPTTIYSDLFYYAGLLMKLSFWGQLANLSTYSIDLRPRGIESYRFYWFTRAVTFSIYLIVFISHAGFQKKKKVIR